MPASATAALEARTSVRQTAAIVGTEYVRHEFLVSFAHFYDEGPVCRWSDSGDLVTVALYMGNRQRDPQASTPDKRDHYQDADRILKGAREWLEARTALWDARQYLWSFRLTGRHRVWGLLVDGVFYLLWNDPQHAIYPTDVQDR